MARMPDQRPTLRSMIAASRQNKPAGTPAERRRTLFSWLSGLLVCGVGLVRVGYLVAHPETAIGAVPDDAFYYLKLAQNRVLLGVWTFDGVSPTSGFHLLHAYGLVVLDEAFDKTDPYAVRLVRSGQ